MNPSRMMDKFQSFYAKPRNRAFLTFCLIWIIAFAISLTVMDPDFGWHLQTGTYILQHGIPSHDIYTYTAPTFPWINHEWLNDVINSFIYHYAGFTGVAAFFALVWAAGMTLAARMYELPAILLSFISILDFVLARPSAWFLLFIALLERILDQARRSLLLSLPFIMLLWANIHGSFIIGLLLIIFYKVFYKTPIAWTVIIASIAATFINPYGPQIYIEIFRTAFDSQLHTRINEWQSFILPAFFIISGAILIAIFFATEKNIKQKKFILPVLFALAALSSVRYYLLFMASTVRYFEQSMKKLRDQIVEKYDTLTMLFFFISITTAIVGIGSFYILHSNPAMPDQSISYLQQHTCPGNIFNFYDYGGYLIWKHPEQKVFIDGRMPSWKENGVDYFGLYQTILTNPISREAIFSHYSIRCVLFTSSNQPFITSLKSQGWQTVFEEPGSILLER